MHALRHTCASLLGEHATAAEVRDLVGHHSVAITDRYLHRDGGAVPLRWRHWRPGSAPAEAARATLGRSWQEGSHSPSGQVFTKL